MTLMLSFCPSNRRLSPFRSFSTLHQNTSEEDGGEETGAEDRDADMEVVLLGTGSSIPLPSRGVSGLCLRHKKDLWLFDGGEGSQVCFAHTQREKDFLACIFVFPCVFIAV